MLFPRIFLYGNIGEGAHLAHTTKLNDYEAGGVHYVRRTEVTKPAPIVTLPHTLWVIFCVTPTYTYSIFIFPVLCFYSVAMYVGYDFQFANTEAKGGPPLSPLLLRSTV